MQLVRLAASVMSSFVASTASDHHDHEIFRLRTEDQSWEGLLREWEQQCVLLGEDFSNYELEPISVVKELATRAIKTDACVCAYHNGTMHAAICQINVATLPVIRDRS